MSKLVADLLQGKALFQQVCGARMTASYFRVGGLAMDIPEGFLDRCQKFVDEMPAHTDEYEALLTRNPIWLARTQGVATLPMKRALAMGAAYFLLLGLVEVRPPRKLPLPFKAA